MKYKVKRKYRYNKTYYQTLEEDSQYLIKKVVKKLSERPTRCIDESQQIIICGNNVKIPMTELQTALVSILVVNKGIVQQYSRLSKEVGATIPGIKNMVDIINFKAKGIIEIKKEKHGLIVEDVRI